MKKYKLNIYFIFLLWLTSISINAQSNRDKLDQIQNIVKKEGELFLAIDRINPENNKVCLEENSITNQVQFSGDSVFVNYINYTELFCEVYVMRSQHMYLFNLKDIDPASMRLVEKKYTIGTGKLREGKPGWFEVQLFTRDKKNAAIRQDFESKQKEAISTVSLIVQEKETARQILALLKSYLYETYNL